MAGKSSREGARLIRKQRVRKQIRGTDATPRLCVYRSLKFTYAQLISDESGKVLLSASTRGSSEKSAKSVSSATELGKTVAALAKEKQITSIVFDRNGYLFHGRVKAVADGAREAGLQF